MFPTCFESMPLEYAEEFIPQPCLLKGEFLMNDKVENKTHAHPHKVAEGSCRAEFLSGKGNDHFFGPQDLHQQTNGVIAAINGNAAGNGNGKEIFDDLSGGFSGITGVKSQKFCQEKTYGDRNEVTHPKSADVIPVKKINQEGGSDKILDNDPSQRSYEIAYKVSIFSVEISCPAQKCSRF